MFIEKRRGVLKLAQSSRDVEFHLSKYKRSLAKSGVPSEVKKRQHHVKKGVLKKQAKEEGIKNTQKRNKTTKFRDKAA